MANNQIRDVCFGFEGDPLGNHRPVTKLRRERVCSIGWLADARGRRAAEREHTVSCSKREGEPIAAPV